VIDLSSKLSVSFSPRDAQGLEHAKPSEFDKIEISPSSFGIHFPKIDADLYVPALLEGFLGSTKWTAPASANSEVDPKAVPRKPPPAPTVGWAEDPLKEKTPLGNRPKQARHKSKGRQRKADGQVKYCLYDQGRIRSVPVLRPRSGPLP
jgi:Protein of unknown function (DUF2442)